MRKAKNKALTTPPECLVEEAISRLTKAEKSLSDAKATVDEARERVCRLLRNFDVMTCHPVIRHHIINTECRRLTPEEITRVYWPES